MLDCLAACNNVSITCIWCMLVSTWYPKILGALGDNSRNRVSVSGNDAKISRLLDGKVSPDPDDLNDSNCRRITIPRPSSKETM
ncbi:uncharacterized protein LOC143358242 [Halictus rubicundus]|uniref:uncharacterized protein LOC143358242 n=1 Tax=Halictus rubicundus TaxID=77578 RepID=UPI004036E034